MALSTCSLGLHSRFWFQFHVLGPLRSHPCLGIVPWVLGTQVLPLKGNSWVWVSTVHYFSNLLPTPLCSTWCQIPCCIHTTCLSGPLPSAAFVSQPLSGCLLPEPYLCFSLVVAILHNLIYSGLTHPIIIQDLVLTGKNIKKKKRRYIQGKQKREAKWCNEWALHLEWSSSLNSATSYLHDLSQVTKPFGNFGFLIDHMKEVDQMVIQIPSSPGILWFYMQVRKLLKVSWTLLRVRNKKAGA